MDDEVPQLSFQASADPLRHPNWRHQRAEQLVSANRFTSVRDVGSDIHDIATFLRAQRMLGSPASNVLLERCPAELKLAYAIRYRNQHVSAALEALILADMPCQEIADLFGLPTSCADWYEAAFFDVRDRLASPGYIMLAVIERARQQYPNDWTQHGWKLIGYQVGSAALIGAIGLAKPEDPTQLSPALRAGTLHVLEDKLRQAAQTLRARDPMTIARTLQILQAEAAKSEAFRPNEYEANIAALLSQLTWSTGKRYSDMPAFAEFADSAGELRADELARLASGETLENAEQIKAMKMPPPRSARSEDESWQ